MRGPRALQSAIRRNGREGTRQTRASRLDSAKPPPSSERSQGEPVRIAARPSATRLLARARTRCMVTAPQSARLAEVLIQRRSIAESAGEVSRVVACTTARTRGMATAPQRKEADGT